MATDRGNTARLVQQGVTGYALAAVSVAVAHRLHGHGDAEPSALAGWLRGTTMLAPLTVAVVLAVSGRRVSGGVVRRLPGGAQGLAGRVAWALAVGVAAAGASVPFDLWNWWTAGPHHTAMAAGPDQALHLAAAWLAMGFLTALLMALVAGTTWNDPPAEVPRPLARPDAPSRRPLTARTVALVTAGGLVASLATVPAASAAIVAETPAQVSCAAGATRTLRADVVALDQAFDYNRLGATNPAGMIFALRQDVVTDSGAGLSSVAPAAASALAGKVSLRPDKRPRPLTLRANVNDCLEITFQNLLAPTPVHSDQPAERRVGLEVKGLSMVGGIDSTGTFVGRNGSGFAAPGETRTYTVFAEHEGTFLIDSSAAIGASEAAGGTASFGLFGALNVEPMGTVWYRSQVTRAEMDLAASAWQQDVAGEWTPSPGNLPVLDAQGVPVVRTTADGQPVVNYDAVRPGGRPILRVLDDAGRIAHADLNAVISGAPADGWKISRSAYPASYWDNQTSNTGERRGEEPFREFTVIFHDEVFARQAFPLFSDARFEHALHGVKDGFAINYGSGGVGSEIIANRLGLGPMAQCTDCKFEEFFLTAWAVGDPAMVVDRPASKNVDAAGRVIADPQRATVVYFPDDPSNVHHSYLNDRVKFRNLHAGPKEHHIFHLHAHQWQYTPNSKKSSYLDSQLIGPGAGYTYEIAYGGSGNRNKTVGDSIFHCHFYPHFAQGMWELWRTHDVFERGTVLDADGRPAPGSRALPDGEIVAGTPIPAVVPLPSRPMAPPPNAKTTVVPYSLATGATTDAATADSSQLDNDGDGVADVESGFAAQPAANPGFPFFVPGVAGHRPPTPALDIAWTDTNGNGTRDFGEVRDGGLPRHVVVGGTAEHFETPYDFNKTLHTAKLVVVPEEGTPAEKQAMAFHGRLWHDTYLPNGSPVSGTTPVVAPGGRPLEGFETNGLPAQPGAPFADPCRAEPTAGNGWAVGSTVPAGARGNGNVPATRSYAAAAVQLDVEFNKLGWHFPQQRIESLWADVGPLLARQRAPQPLVMRLATGDCAQFWHTNLVPNVYQLDDYQVRTPTDVIGQHIHLVKFDVTSADGSANGFNYEDGTLSPQEVTERIDAVRAENQCAGDGRLDAGDTWTQACPLAVKDSYFGSTAALGDLVWGARTTVQRWFADPLLNDAWDNGLGAVFTHDHFGPSTHQQTGLYATVLVEPTGTSWRDSESGQVFGGRTAGTGVVDGGPTSWKADVYWAKPGSAGTADPVDARNANAHREFYLEFADFQHAYQRAGGRLHTRDNGAGVQIPSYDDFPNAVNPSFRQAPPGVKLKDLFLHPNRCPDGTARPCPEAISADDVGTMVVNYRNEPVAARVFDPATRTQAKGDRGDLALAFQSRTDRAMPELNVQPTTYPELTAGVTAGDPYTPMLRVYSGDKIRVRAQVGATEEQHTIMFHGLKWQQEGLDPDSGWRNSQSAGISEYFNLTAPLQDNLKNGGPPQVDHLYTMGTSTEDLWNGMWGLLRAYTKSRSDLTVLPSNPMPKNGWSISNTKQITNQGCPTTVDLTRNGAAVPERSYALTAVRAADVLGPPGIVYNARTTPVRSADGSVQGAGPLVDPTALMYVFDGDLVKDKKGRPIGLQPGTPVEPPVLRANAGDCIKVKLTNALPVTVPTLPSFNALPPILQKDRNADGAGGIVSFGRNDLTPSSRVGLHVQLLAYDARVSDGLDVGVNAPKQPLPGTSVTYHFFAGDFARKLDANGYPAGAATGSVELAARPVEFGGVNLLPADRITGTSSGLVAALVVEPQGATWTTDPTSRLSASVTLPGGTVVREAVTVVRDDLGLRYGGRCTPSAANLQCAVPAVASEGRGVPEDTEDSGQKALGFRSEPLWFRLGVAPDTPFTHAALTDRSDLHAAFSNTVTDGADPQVPPLTARAGQAVRLHLLQPGGHARGHVWSITGHAWQREPYVLGSDRISWAAPTDGDLSGPPAPGESRAPWWSGAQDGIGPTSHFTMVLPRAGGHFGVPGDYLVRDSASFGSWQGLWTLLRVTP